MVPPCGFALRWFRPARSYVAVLPLRLGVWASDHRRLSLVALNPGVLGGQAPCVSLRSVLLPRIAWGLQVDRVIPEPGRLELSGSGCPGPGRILTLGVAFTPGVWASVVAG